ncbi:MAG: glycosyltransferase family 39 protein [Acidobacteriota bacterium]
MPPRPGHSDLRHRPVPWSALVPIPLLAIAAWATLFHGLGASAIDTFHVDEAMHTGVTLELARTGAFHPTYHGTPYYGKPPLKMWITARLVNLFGPSLAVLRAPDAVAALFTGIAIWIFGRTRWGQVASALAPVVLWTSPHFVFLHGARDGVQDSFLTLLFTLSVLAWWRGVDRGDALMTAAALMSAGILVKSVVAYLPLGIGIGFYLLSRRTSLLRHPGFWCALLLPWVVFYLYHGHIYDSGGELSHDIGDRIFRWPTHREPWWRFASWIGEGIAPWSWALPVGAGVAALRLVKRTDHPDARLLLWILGVLVPFSIAVSKLPWYAYPAYPAMALLAARTICPPELWSAPGRRPVKALSCVLASALAVASVARTYARTCEPRTSPGKRAIEASAAPEPSIVYVFGMPATWLCPDEELYLEAQHARVVAVTGAALAKVLSAEKAARVIAPEASLPELVRAVGIDVAARARVARFAGECRVMEKDKQEQPVRALLAFDRKDLPPELAPFSTVFATRGFFPPEPGIGDLPMRWMGRAGSLVAFGQGRVRLGFKAKTLGKSRELVGTVAGRTVLDERVEDWREVISAPFEAAPEGTTLELTTREGCDAVKDLVAGTEDARCVSVAMAGIELRDAP